MQLLQSEDFLDKISTSCINTMWYPFWQIQTPTKDGRTFTTYAFSVFPVLFGVFCCVLQYLLWLRAFLRNSKLSKQFFTFNMQLKLIKSISSPGSFLNLREQTVNDIVLQFRVWKKNLKETCKITSSTLEFENLKIWDNFAVFRYKRSKSGYLIDVELCSIGLRDSTHSYVLSRKKLFLEKSEVQHFLNNLFSR